MQTATTSPITVQTTVNAPIEKVWNCFNEPEDVKQWAFASPDWHVPYSENDLRTDGKFKTTMAAKDGSFSFDFEGVYTNVQPQKLIEYIMADGRKVSVKFNTEGNQTVVVEAFDPETENSRELQQGGWQAILDNFKKYTEGHK